MIGFDEAYAKICALAGPLEHEEIALEDAPGRVLTRPIIASSPRPGFDCSAMDGFALAGESENYQIKGEIAAGGAGGQQLKPGEAMRIYTGAPLPKGADRILIFEDAREEDGCVRAKTMPGAGAHIRKQGSDFEKGFQFATQRRLTPRDIGLIAAMDVARVNVHKRPGVRIFSTGSELYPPGEAAREWAQPASNAYGIRALGEQFGAQAGIGPIIEDRLDALKDALDGETRADIIVTTGGVSVGKFDLLREAAQLAGFDIALHKVAMRPGKPVLVATREIEAPQIGKKGERADQADGAKTSGKTQILLALPGNPVSAMIGAYIFLRGIILTMQGAQARLPAPRLVALSRAIEPNGERMSFLRARLNEGENEDSLAIFSSQDGSFLRILSEADGLVMRAPFAGPLRAGELVRFLDFRAF